MDDLLREAIADAKAVRETALANAKIALEEAFTPRLKSMLSRKIESEMDAEEMEDKEETEDSEEMREEEDAEERMDADEEEMDAEERMDADEMEKDAEEIAMDKDETEDAEEMEDKEEDELDLESVLAELEADLNKDEEDELDESEDKEEEEKVDENDVSSQIGSADNKVNPEAGDTSKVGQGPESEGSDKKSGDELGDHETVDDLTEVEDKDEEDLDLDEVLKALTEEDKEEEDAEENEKLKAEIKEHRKVIHFMRSKLNEVNLLNAKLLFSNKLFRAFGLNNNQKLKVVETFDRTKNLREVKLVYATLAESFKKPSNRISESVKKGSASKPVRSTKPKAVLSEGAELKARFKKLANIL